MFLRSGCFRRFIATDAFGTAARLTPLLDVPGCRHHLTDAQKKLMARGLPRRAPIPGVKHIIAVASGKGGVGKSTTAVNLALATSEITKQNVGILDADVFGPSLPQMMNLSQEPDLDAQNMMIPLVNYNVKCMSMGFLIGERDPVIWRGPMVISAIDRLLRKVSWGEVDYLFVDLPPGTGDIQLSLTQNVPVTGAVLVTTPQDVALLDVRRGAEMFRRVDVPILGVVQNMAVFTCPSCGHREHIFGKEGAARLAFQIHVDLLGDVPLDMSICSTSDSGQPITISSPQGSIALCYKNIAQKLLDKLHGKKTEPP